MTKHTLFIGTVRHWTGSFSVELQRVVVGTADSARAGAVADDDSARDVLHVQVSAEDVNGF